MKGSIKIGVFNNYNMFIDLCIEEGYKNIWFKGVIECDGLQMWLQTFSPNFKSKEDLSHAPAWALLQNMPYHLNNGIILNNSDLLFPRKTL